MDILIRRRYHYEEESCCYGFTPICCANCCFCFYVLQQSKCNTGLEARNVALTAYLQKNVDATVIYDENRRATLIEEFFDTHPEFNSVKVKQQRSHEPKAIEKAAIYRETLQTTANTDQTVEMDVTYYDDGSYVLGIFTSHGETY